jgi:hypothetical protein
MAIYKMTVELSEFDIDMIDRIAAHTGYGRSDALHLALAFCDSSLSYNKQGYYTTVLYENGYSRGCTATISAHSVAEKFNNRNPDAQSVTVKMLRSTQTLQYLQNIKTAMNIQSDAVAIGFALEYAATTIDRLQTANNGKAARIFFTKTNNPHERGYTLVKHPFDINLANKWRRATRRMKQGIQKLNPLKAKPKQYPALPAPEQKVPAAAPDTSAQSNVPEQESVSILKPVKLKKSGQGFVL